LRYTSPRRYDDRTWEHVVYEGNLAAGIYLAMFFEHKSKAQPRDAVALNEAAVEVYEFMYSSPAYSAHIQDFWHKNTGLAYHNLHSLTRKKEYGLKMKKCECPHPKGPACMHGLTDAASPHHRITVP